MKENLLQSGQLMLFGMGGVFLVLFLIYLISRLLIKLFPVEKRE
ncbi:MAG: OadG family protein [Streptococcaceae bacterium]|jgi:Na+-transporting methylmalonyl-CoA/oxaloacetate decarboxylase gamma subunit|nr:OadG family protein [Streptococcaceae bacterium]MCH4176332.1 OadG family protein [Streptococcaceae bacterium]